MKWVLGSLWIGSLGLSLILTGFYMEGLLWDHARAGDPEIAMDLAGGSDWRTDRFRVWESKDYALSLLSSAQSPTSGIQFRGKLEVRIVDPSGREFFRNRYEPGVPDPSRLEARHWTVLDTLTVPVRGLRRWTFATRVLEPDSLLAGAESRITFAPHRFDPGMGGILYDLVILPAAFFGFLSLLPGVYLARRESPIPLRLSRIWAVLVGLLLFAGLGL